MAGTPAAIAQWRRSYYTDDFPFKAIVWLTTRLGDELVLREWAIDADDYYKRYVTAKDVDEFRARMEAHRGLVALHAGPVWYKKVTKPALNQDTRLLSEAPHPHRRELVFDIDLNDYDFLDLHEGPPNPGGLPRPLSLEKCDAAWPVAGIAVQLLVKMLHEQFGFGDFLCCYSGRRGVHLWVLDERAMVLDNEGRSAIASFLDIAKQLTKDEKRATDAHRLFVKRHNLMETVHALFQDVIVGQMGALDTSTAREDFLERLDLSEHESMHNLADEVSRKDSGLDAWKYIKTKVCGQAKKHSKACGWFAARLDELVLAYVWPRIDFNVTKSTNHLIKSPFVAHPKTLRIAVPLRADELLSFDPATAPTLGAEGWREALVARGGHPDGKGLADWVWHMKSPLMQASPTVIHDAMDVDMEDLVPDDRTTPEERSMPKASRRCDVYGVPLR